MRTLSAVLTVAAITVGPKTFAADDAKASPGERVRETFSARIADLSLTDEQETKIAEIRKEFRPKIAEAGKELAAVAKEEVEKVRALLTADQKEKLQAMKDERKERRWEGLAERIAHLRDLDLTDAEMAQIGEIREECRPRVEKVLKQLSNILTDEQKKARVEALKAGKTRREIRESLNLTSEQREKLEAVGKELATVIREELEKMRSVLTSEQQEKLAPLKEERKERVRDRLACAIANFADLNLTDEQKTKIAEIREEYRPKVHEAGNKLRAAVRQELAQLLAVLKG